MSMALQTGRRFAETLDADDFAGARACLAADCVYEVRGSTVLGAKDIITMYRRIGEWVRETFESVEYGSRVSLVGERVRIEFSDHIRHGEQRLDFRCEQWLRVQGTEIVHIEHVDLPGMSEAAAAFNELCGVQRPG